MNRLVVIREALGFKSRNKFAKALDINPSYINRLESDKQAINRNFVDKVCAAFPQVNREFLEQGIGEPLLEVVPAESDIDVAMRVISDRVKRLDPDLQTEVYKLCRRILDQANLDSPADAPKKSSKKKKSKE